jgi:hypothetical protein
MILPKVFDKEGFKFFFYTDEGNEPPHVHVSRQGEEAKFWISPVRFASNDGLSAKELAKARKLVIQHEQQLKDKWDEHSNKKK